MHLKPGTAGADACIAAAAHYLPAAGRKRRSLLLQNHNTLVRYKYIWARKIGAYDTPEKK